MKTFKEFLLEQDEKKYRRIIKFKTPQKTTAYTYPIGVGGAYYGLGGDMNASGSGGGE